MAPSLSAFFSSRRFRRLAECDCADAMLDGTFTMTARTILANCVQFLLRLLFLLHNQLLTFALLANLKNVCRRYLFGEPKAEQQCLGVVPRHLALMFIDKEVINFECIADVIAHSLNCGIERVSLYDPWSFLSSRREELEEVVNCRANIKSSSDMIVFDREADKPRINGTKVKLIKVAVLGARDGKEGLVRACKKLSRSSEEVTPSRIAEKLREEMISEPDFLVAIGPAHSCLAGYPPFSLRVTELSQLRRFESYCGVSEREFYALLQPYSSRDRRIGR